ncbi:hypothetical protein ACFYY2_30635 [Streptomyces sp. NPDC001822]|uniref:hypothetical protein n=1 Tax=Streptomyces sp. NPDC001822 TaxID=3364614 RepID=UPI0036B4FC0D
MARTRKHRVAAAIGVFAAVIGMTAGVCTTSASAAPATKPKCYASVWYDGHWVTVRVPCA